MALIGWHTQFAGRSQPGKGKRDPKVKSEGRGSKFRTLRPSVFRPSHQSRFSRQSRPSRLSQALDTQRR
jgi:hypothetical protein